MAFHIIPRLIGGRLFFQVREVSFAMCAATPAAWFAAHAHGLDIVEVSP